MLATRIGLFGEFIRSFIRNATRVGEVILILLSLIFAGAFAISRIEGILLGDAVYFSFITALSVGYGDIKPSTGLGKAVSVAIGLVGMMFIGITVAIANRSLADTVKRHEKDWRTPRPTNGR